MPAARLLISLASLLLAATPACRTASSARVEDAPQPSRTSVAPTAEPTPSPSAAAASRPSPASLAESRPSPAAPVSAPKTVAAEPNRDKHGNADVAAYVEVLQNEKRVTELQVGVVLEKLALPPDALIGDLGCGPGVFTTAFARTCPDGIVFASDIEPRQLDVVRAKMHAANLRNIVPVLASEDDAHLPPGLLDVVFIADTYHHLDGRVAYLRRLSKALKPGGRLVILDYKPGKLNIGPPPEHKLAAGVMDKELVEAGWKLVERFDTHPFHDFEVWRLVQPWEKK